MKTMTVGEFKSRFSEVLEWIRSGEEVAVTYGKAKKIVGYFMPNTKKTNTDLKIGLLDNTEGYYMSDDFCETTEDEFPIS